MQDPDPYHGVPTLIDPPRRTHYPGTTTPPAGPLLTVTPCLARVSAVKSGLPGFIAKQWHTENTEKS